MFELFPFWNEGSGSEHGNFSQFINEHSDILKANKYNLLIYWGTWKEVLVDLYVNLKNARLCISLFICKPVFLYDWNSLKNWISLGFWRHVAELNFSLINRVLMLAWVSDSRHLTIFCWTLLFRVPLITNQQ